MGGKQKKDLISDIVNQVTTVDYEDLQQMADLHTLCEDLMQDLHSHENVFIVEALKLSIKLVADIMLDGVSDRAASMQTLIASVEMISRALLDGHDVNRMSFPKELYGDINEEEITDEFASLAAAAPEILESLPEDYEVCQDMSLIKDFVHESTEHIQDINNELLILEKEPHNEEALNAIFRSFHTLKGVAGFLELTDIRSLSHESETLLDKARKGELQLTGIKVDLIFEISDFIKELVSYVAKYVQTGTLRKVPERVNIYVAKIKSVIADEEYMNTEGIVEESVLSENLDAVVGEALHASTALGREAIKIDAQKLDKLVDMIGELVIAESMVSQFEAIKDIASPKFSRYLNQLDKISRELHEIGMSLRMVPLKQTFQKMARLIRDLSKKMNKEINFEMYGEDTELDKTVVEKIHDPLVHMIRNALDHGIESTSVRVEKGKPAAGRIQLSAYHKGGSIYIEIRDDGKGLSKEAILAKALDRGIIQDPDVLSDREIYNLIFEPGFSTAERITDISGRGVGMDVVKRNIDALHGQIDIVSTPDEGTIFYLRLPLTLAIIDGMFVRIGKEKYIIPSLSIIRSIRPTQEQLSTVVNKGDLLKIKDKLIPVFHIGKLFEIDHTQQHLTHSMIVIVEDEGKQVGLVIDELLSQQQVVIKNLGGMMKNIAGISGCTIMPDGNVGLILDVAGLVRMVQGRMEQRVD